MPINLFLHGTGPVCSESQMCHIQVVKLKVQMPWPSTMQYRMGSVQSEPISVPVSIAGNLIPMLVHLCRCNHVCTSCLGFQDGICCLPRALKF